MHQLWAALKNLWHRLHNPGHCYLCGQPLEHGDLCTSEDCQLEDAHRTAY